MRKQLDVLMGVNRNGDVLEISRKYFDSNVCHLFLSGLCPHDLFQLTTPLKYLTQALKQDIQKVVMSYALFTSIFSIVILKSIPFLLLVMMSILFLYRATYTLIGSVTMYGHSS
ncbi:hypothetical protein ABZP36_010228 [Zizania latifolia]